MKMVIETDDWQALQDIVKLNETLLKETKVVLKELTFAYEVACLDGKMNPTRLTAYVKAKDIIKDIV
jgi:hypothetical protein